MTDALFSIFYFVIDNNSQFGDDWPLSKSQIRTLRINHDRFVDLLETDELCIKLYSTGVLSQRQRNYISEIKHNAKKNELFLDMLDRFSLRQYKITIYYLLDTKQDHIALILSEGGADVQIQENHDGDEDVISKDEKEIVAGIIEKIKDRPLKIASRILELVKLGLFAANHKKSELILI